MQSGSFEFPASLNTFYLVVSNPEEEYLHIECVDGKELVSLPTGTSGLPVLGRRRMLVSDIANKHSVWNPEGDWFDIGTQPWKSNEFEGTGSVRLSASRARV